MRRALLFLFMAFFLAACATSSGYHPVRQYGGPKTKPDPALERFIVLSYPKAKEKIALTYYKKGAYLPDAMRQIDNIFRDRHNGKSIKIDPELIDFLVDIRSRLGLPPTVVFELLSGYRSRETNEALRVANNQVAKESLHMYGWAVDFRIAGVSGSAIAEIAKTMQRGGVSFYPADNHVHVDLGNIRTWKTK